ncbi:hypothetical protein ACJX0J_036538, partial [Zea mays]
THYYFACLIAVFWFGFPSTVHVCVSTGTLMFSHSPSHHPVSIQAGTTAWRTYIGEKEREKQSEYMIDIIKKGHLDPFYMFPMNLHIYAMLAVAAKLGGGQQAKFDDTTLVFFWKDDYHFRA